MPNPTLLSLCLACLLAGCAVPDDPGMRYIGHGGSGNASHHAMNSAQALIGGMALGLDGIELDVQLTADSVLVAYHAATLDELTACTGKVNATTWEQLKACPNTKEGGPYPLVRVDALLALARERYPAVDITLDCKLFAAGEWWPYLHTYARAIARLDSTLHHKLLMECQVEDLLDLVQRARPEIALYLYSADAEAATRRAATSHYAGITVHVGAIDAEAVKAAHDLGLTVTVFGVEGWWSQRKALRMHVDRIQTDVPFDRP